MNYIESKTKNQEQKYLFSPDIIIPKFLNADKVRYFLHVILIGKYSRKHDDDGTTRISSKLMQYLLGERDEVKTRRWLRDTGIIFTDDVYSEGRFSKSYGINPKYKKIKRFPMKNENLIAKIQLAHSQRIEAHASPLIDDYLNKWLNSFDFNLKDCEKEGFDNIHYMNVTDIINKNMSVITDHYGRKHSPYSTLLTEMRKHITYKNECLFNVDISNSQIIQVNKLLKEIKLKKEIKEKEEKKEEKKEIIDNISNNNKILLTICYDTFGKIGNSFSDKVESGEIYDYLLAESLNDPEIINYLLFKRLKKEKKKKWNDLFLEYICELGCPKNYKKLKKQFSAILRQKEIEAEVSQEITRKDFKQVLFADVFFANIFIQTPITKLFEKLFPLEYNLIIEFKKENGYEELARDCQRQEAHIMYNCVGERLRRSHPDVPVIFIHDSIMTTEHYTHLVERIIKEEYERAGYKINIKVKKA